MLRLLERPVKEAQWKKRNEVNEIIRSLQKAQEDLEKAGMKTDFIYERDSNGIPTGYFISEIDRKRFMLEKSKLEDSLNGKWGIPSDTNKYNSAWYREWYE